MAEIKIKRSSVPAKAPATTDLVLGELAINTYDGKLYLKKNNGTESIVEVANVNAPTFTGNVTATGNLISSNSSGDEGGEILLAKPQTNSTIAGTGVTIDVYQNKLRIFEQGGSARGVYIDLTAAAAGVATNLLTGGAGGGGTVTSVSGTGTVSGLTLTGTVTSSGDLTLGGTLSVTASNFSSQTANTFLAAPNGTTGTPTFRAIVAADIPVLNQDTTGTASNITGTYSGTLTSAQVTAALGFTPGTGNVTLDGTETLSNKTLARPVLSMGASSLLAGSLGYTVGLLNYGDGTNLREIVNTDSIQTLSSKTLTSPTLQSPRIATGGTNGTSGTLGFFGAELKYGDGVVERIVANTDSSQTFTNKRVTPRIVSTTSASPITPTGDTADQYVVTALAAAATIAAPTGTPTDGQRLVLRIEDNGTPRALTWTTGTGAYRAVGVTLPTTTVAAKTLYIGMIYNSQDVFWDILATAVLA